MAAIKLNMSRKAFLSDLPCKGREADLVGKCEKEGTTELGEGQTNVSRITQQTCHFQPRSQGPCDDSPGISFQGF